MSYTLHQVYKLEIGLIPVMVLYILSFLIVVLTTRVHLTWQLVMITSLIADTWLYFGFIEHMRIALIQMGILHKKNAKRA